MKRSVLVFFFLGLLSLGVIAQVNPAAKSDSIVFNKMVHDYGTLEQGADGSCEFKFTNNGKVPVVLSGVHASCGCTTPEWPREPILPGQTGVIKVKYDTRRLGAIDRTVVVNSNASNSTVVLRIKGNVVAKL